MDAEKLIISTFKPHTCYTGSNTMYKSSSENSSRACATAVQGDRSVSIDGRYYLFHIHIGSFYFRISRFMYIPISDRIVYLYNNNSVFGIMFLRFLSRMLVILGATNIFIQKCIRKLILKVVSACVKI